MNGYNSGEYNFEQQTFCLSCLTVISFSLSGKAAEIESKLKSAIENALNDPASVKLMGRWKLVWGPAVYADAYIGKQKSLNSMFIAVPESHPEQAVVAIAGTNGTSLMNWVTEDFNVKEKVAWPYAEVPSNPMISKGIALGLEKLIALTAPKGEANGLTSARDFLSAHSEITEIMVTGHSLGGALSPTYTLYLENTREEWAASDAVRLSCLPTAGQSPGDGTFSKYYDDVLGSRTKRVWNSRDVVPHAFNLETLSQTPSLYMPNLPTGPGMVKLVEWIQSKVAGLDYTNLSPETEGFPFSYIKVEELSGKYKPLVNSLDDIAGNVQKVLIPLKLNFIGSIEFLMQALLQHTIAYVQYYKVDDFLGIMLQGPKKADSDHPKPNSFKEKHEAYEAKKAKFNASIHDFAENARKANQAAHDTFKKNIEKLKKSK